MQQTIFVIPSPNFLTLLQYQRWVLFKFHANWAFRGKKGTVHSGSPFLFIAHQLRHVGPASGDDYEKREKTACWIESIQVEFSIS